MESRLTLTDGLKAKARVQLLAHRGRRSSYRLTLTEGQNREVKRIFAHFRLPLLHLHRTRFAGLSADSLPPGKFRRLRRNEINTLYALTAASEQGRQKQMDIPS